MNRLPGNAPLVTQLLRLCGVSVAVSTERPRMPEDESPTGLTSSALGWPCANRSLTASRWVGVGIANPDCAKGKPWMQSGRRPDDTDTSTFGNITIAMEDLLGIGTVSAGHRVSPLQLSRIASKPHHHTDAGTNASAGTDCLRRDVDIYSFSASAELPTFTMTENKESSNKPVCQIGTGVNAKMFANVTKDGQPFDKVQIVRTYKDGKEFKATPSYSIDELPLVAMYAMKMYEIGVQRRIERSKANANGGQSD